MVRDMGYFKRCITNQYTNQFQNSFTCFIQIQLSQELTIVRIERLKLICSQALIFPLKINMQSARVITLKEGGM